jgi:hypothetical protein
MGLSESDEVGLWNGCDKAESGEGNAIDIASVTSNQGAAFAAPFLFHGISFALSWDH